MKLVFIVIAMVCGGLIVREIWAIRNVYSALPALQKGGVYCGAPMFTGENVWKDVLAILLTGASLLPVAIAPWVISRVVSHLPMPTKQQLSELWWTIRGRNR